MGAMACGARGSQMGEPGSRRQGIDYHDSKPRSALSRSLARKDETDRGSSKEVGKGVAGLAIKASTAPPWPGVRPPLPCCRSASKRAATTHRAVRQSALRFETPPTDAVSRS